MLWFVQFLSCFVIFLLFLMTVFRFSFIQPKLRFCSKVIGLNFKISFNYATSLDMLSPPITARHISSALITAKHIFTALVNTLGTADVPSLLWSTSDWRKPRDGRWGVGHGTGRNHQSSTFSCLQLGGVPVQLELAGANLIVLDHLYRDDLKWGN